MDKDKIFFSEDGKGLTSTSAGFCANMAKELYQATEAALNSMVFYTTTVKLMGSSTTDMLKEGVTTVKDIPEALEMIAKLKSLIAWLRESVRAKERLIKEAQDRGYEYYDIKVPESPKREDYISSDDVIAEFNIKQRNRYYYLEAFCATIGQYIHPGGVYATERDQLQKIIHEPNTVSGSGRDALLYSRKPSLDPQEVEDTFMGLQQTYREYQAELNSIKHDIEERLNKDTAEKNIAYAEACKSYSDTMKVLDAELTRKRKEAVTAASNLKIVIPDSLKDIYEKVSKLGKQ